MEGEYKSKRSMDGNFSQSGFKNYIEAKKKIT